MNILHQELANLHSGDPQSPARLDILINAFLVEYHEIGEENDGMRELIWRMRDAIDPNHVNDWGALEVLEIVARLIERTYLPRF